MDRRLASFDLERHILFKWMSSKYWIATITRLVDRKFNCSDVRFGVLESPSRFYQLRAIKGTNGIHTRACIEP